MAKKATRKTARSKQGSTVKDLSLRRRRADSASTVKGGVLKRGRRADCEPGT